VEGLEKLSMDLGFGNFVRLLSPSSFGIAVRTQARLLNSFLTLVFLQMVVLKKRVYGAEC